MWIIDDVFSYSVSPAATNNRAEWRLLPTVVFQEFSTKNDAGRLNLRLKEVYGMPGEKLRSGMEDLKAIGKAYWLSLPIR